MFKLTRFGWKRAFSTRHGRVSGPLKDYMKLVEQQQLKMDEHQLLTVRLLQNMHDRLRNYDLNQYTSPSTGAQTKSSWFTSLFKTKQKSVISNDTFKDHEQGLYMYGSVGTGKTLLMDLFYHAQTTPHKSRVHFHSFMLQIHQRVHELGSTRDAIPQIAAEIAKKSWLLCFDEFQVTDIADAMILRRLLTEMFQRGIVVVITSNRHPDDLYKNGIQRQSFLPCIELLKKRCFVHSLNSEVDYRKMERVMVAQAYYHPLDEQTDKDVDMAFSRLIRGRKSRPRVIHTTTGRPLYIPSQCPENRVAKFTFSELCSEALSAVDYLTLVKYYETLVIEHVPRLSISKNRDEIRRWITLLDVVYENGTKLVLSAEVPLVELFDTGDGWEGHDEVFALARAMSRLTQMQSKQWWEQTRPSKN